MLNKIQSCTDVVKVDGDHQDFDQELHQEIFVADKVESMLVAHTKLLLVSTRQRAFLHN